MTSNDMSTLTLLLEKHFAETAKQLSDMRADNAEFREQMQKDNAEFREQMRQDMREFKEVIRTDIEAFKGEVNTRFDNMQEQVAIMHDDITGLKHDVAGLYHWDYWLLSIIIVVIAMPQIASGVKLLFSAVAEGLGLIISVFRKEGK